MVQLSSSGTSLLCTRTARSTPGSTPPSLSNSVFGTTRHGEKIDIMGLKIEGALEHHRPVPHRHRQGRSARDRGYRGTSARLSVKTPWPSPVTPSRRSTIWRVACSVPVEQVTEWFQQTSDAISRGRRRWPTPSTSSRRRSSTLGGEADLTWDKFKRHRRRDRGRPGHAGRTSRHPRTRSRSPAGATHRREGPARAGLYDLGREGRGGHPLGEQGHASECADIGSGIAEDLGRRDGSRDPEPLLAAVELMVSKLLGIPVEEVRRQVNEMVNGVNQEP